MTYPRDPTPSDLMDIDVDPEAADLRAEDRANRRAYLRATRCQCGGDMPGRCPGPSACPMCQEDDES